MRDRMGAREQSQLDRRIKMANYKLTIEVDDWADMYGDSLTLENQIMDLIKASILPTLNLILNSYQVVRKRG